jgi:hypothetical protein
MKVQVIDNRFRGCAVGCGECHTCRTHSDLSWALAQEKLVLFHLLAAERRPDPWAGYVPALSAPEEGKEYDEMPF